MLSTDGYLRCENIGETFVVQWYAEDAKLIHKRHAARILIEYVEYECRGTGGDMVEANSVEQNQCNKF